jgi:hypothetical protein
MCRQLSYGLAKTLKIDYDSLNLLHRNPSALIASNEGVG